MDRLQAMRVFVRVADSGGFAEAARQLHMSPPAATRAVAALEAAIGARLLTRTTRSVKLTEPGSHYVQDCRRILAEIDEAEAAAAGSSARPTGTLTVTASVQFGRIYVLPLVADYLARYPAMSARTLFVDRIVSMLDENADVAVRIAHLPDSALKATRVGSVRRVVCAAPAYLDRHGTPVTPRDLQRHAIIGSTSTAPSAEWRFGTARKTAVTVHPRLTCNTVDAALDAALAGHGLARLLSYQVAPALAGGLLRIVLSDQEEDAMPIHIVSLDGPRAPAKVRAFIDLAVERLRANPMLN